MLYCAQASPLCVSPYCHDQFLSDFSLLQIQEKMAFITNSGNRMAAIACYLAQHGCNLSQLNWNNQEAISYAGGEQMRSLVREYYRPPMYVFFISQHSNLLCFVQISRLYCNFINQSRGGEGGSQMHGPSVCVSIVALYCCVHFPFACVYHSYVCSTISICV